jgi:hypothetical protein
MKKIIILLGIFGAFALSSCEPRIEMDMGQWGDHAIIDNVQVFKFEVDDDPVLYETMNVVGNISGYRRIIISATAEIDLDNSTVTVPLIGNETLNEAGLIFFHQSVLIEPLDGAPRGGIIGDFSSRTAKYRLHSADGTTRDWTIKIQ